MAQESHFFKLCITRKYLGIKAFFEKSNKNIEMWLYFTPPRPPLQGLYTFSIFCFVPHKILEEGFTERVPTHPSPSEEGRRHDR